MKRVIAVVVMILFLVGFATTLMAQEAETDADTGASVVEQEEGSMEMDQMEKTDKMGWMKKKLMHGKKYMGAAKKLMMSSMMQKKLVATKDGGVVVLAGNKLLKYDKNLELTKEVQIPMDMKCMKEMMENCPMGMKMDEPGEEEMVEAAE